MYKICKTEKSVLRQQEFQNTLLSMMKKKNIHEISITALCKEMNAPRKAFYRYFDTIEDVLYSKMDALLERAFLNLEIKVDVIGFFEFWKGHKEFLDVLERNGLSFLMVNRFYAVMMEDRKISDMQIKYLRYTCYISAFMSVLIGWHHGGMKQTTEELQKMIFDVFRVDHLKSPEE